MVMTAQRGDGQRHALTVADAICDAEDAICSSRLRPNGNGGSISMPISGGDPISGDISGSEGGVAAGSTLRAACERVGVGRLGLSVG